MAAQGVFKITEQFEEAICKYTGAPYCVALDNASNALFLALYYTIVVKKLYPGVEYIGIPERTYPSVPAEIIHVGLKPLFKPVSGTLLKGAYRLTPTNIWDSSLRFTNDMYVSDSYMCLSFTGPYKHLKLGKGGAILTDNLEAYKWFKKARFSGRDECSYHTDNFDDNPVIGWNFYMPVETATRGLHMITQFYKLDGTPISNHDLALPYPDLSTFKCYK